MRLEDLPKHHREQLERKLEPGTKRTPAAIEELEREELAADRERWELELARQFRAFNVHGWEREFVFLDTRKWKFDFAFQEVKIAVEVEGGIWRPGGGAHSRPQAIERDIEKYNTALLAGWIVYRVTPAAIKSGTAIDEIQQLLRRYQKWVSSSGRS